MPELTDKILIFGNGQMGNFYLNYFNNMPNYEAYMANADVTVVDEIAREIEKYNPTVVINAAGKTNLEWIREHELETFNSNTLGANNVAEECAKMGVYYIFLSSGCIFESMNAEDIKKEDDIPSPQAYYSWTKVWAEQLIQWKKPEGFEYLILRPRQPISSEVNHKNMLVKLLTFTRYIDTPNTGTIIEDLMEWTRELMEKRHVGVVNVANEGWSTPYRIALLLKEHVLPELEIDKMTKAELDAITPVKRVDTVLDVSRLKGLVSEVRPYEDRLEEVIKTLGENFRNGDKAMIKEHMEKVYDHTKLRANPNTVWPKLFE